MTLSDERDEFISEQYQVGAAYKEVCGFSPDHYLTDVAEVDSYNLFFGVFQLQEELANKACQDYQIQLKSQENEANQRYEVVNRDIFTVLVTLAY